MKDKKTLKKAKNIFKALKTDPNSVLFTEEKIDQTIEKILKNQNMKNIHCF